MTLKFLKSHVYTFPTINPWIQKQVAQGQYVVSDTRCPLCIIGQRPARGLSPLEHRGTFVHPT